MNLKEYIYERLVPMGMIWSYHTFPFNSPLGLSMDCGQCLTRFVLYHNCVGLLWIRLRVLDGERVRYRQITFRKVKLVRRDGFWCLACENHMEVDHVVQHGNIGELTRKCTGLGYSQLYEARHERYYDPVGHDMCATIGMR